MPEDYGYVPGGQPAGGTPFSSLPQNIQDSANQADINWANADQKYYSAREQSVGGLIGEILAIGGGVFAPYLAPILGSALGVPTALASSLISGGTGALGGIVAGENPGQALLGGLEGGGASFLGSELSQGLQGVLGGLGGAGGGAVDFTGIDPNAFNVDPGAFTAPSASSFINEFNGTAPLLGGGFGGGLLDSSMLGGFGGPAPSTSSFTSEFQGTQPVLPGAPSTSGTLTPDNGNPTVSELTVTAQPDNPSGFPGIGIANNGSGPIGGGGPINSTPPQVDNQPQTGKPDFNKLLQAFIAATAGGTGIVQNPESRGPSGPGGSPVGGGPGSSPGGPGPAGSGSPGGNPNPTGGNGGPGSIDLGGLGGSGFTAPSPPLINTGGPGGGTGAGPGGPGGFDLKSSLAPDIYPWTTGGGL